MTFDGRIQVLDEKSNVLSAIKNIAYSDDQDEAFLVLDCSDLIKKYNTWKSLIPRVKTYYAVKCNDDLNVLEVLAALGTGFDCASREEIEKVLSLGVEPSRIIFANPTVPGSFIKYAASVGVKTITFDCEMELLKMQQFFPTADLVIRIRYDDEEAKYKLGEKFGCDPDNQATDLLKLAKSLNLNVIGVSFHIGCGSKTPGTFSGAIEAAKRVFDSAYRLGYKFQLLDIGGGYPGETGTSIDKIALCVNEALEKYFPDKSIRVISEPGRYYVASAFKLASKVHTVKNTSTQNPQTGISKRVQMCYMNTGVYGCLIPILFDEPFVVKLIGAKQEDKLHDTIIWGCTCDGFDKLAEVPFPSVKYEDWIIFEDAGAYTLTIATKFNGYPIPKVQAVISKKDWLQIRHKFSNEKFIISDKKMNQL